MALPPSLSSLVVVHSLSHVRIFVTPWMTGCQASLSFIISWSLLKLMSDELVMPSNHLVLCHPPCPFALFPSIRVFFNELALPIRWPKYLSFSFSICPSSEYSGLISFRIDWFDLSLLSKGLLRSCPVPQFKSITSSGLSLHYGPTVTSIYMTTGETITLIIQTFFSKVISLL